jgi:hypothetical protein
MVHGQDEHLDVGQLFAQSVRHGQAAHLREVKIQEHDVGQEFSGLGHRLKPISRFPSDEKMTVPRQARANALTHDGMIIYQQYFDAVPHFAGVPIVAGMVAFS